MMARDPLPEAWEHMKLSADEAAEALQRLAALFGGSGEMSERPTHPISEDHTKPCPICGEPLFKGESGAAVGSLTDGPVRNLWRWYCRSCHWYSPDWDGERIEIIEHRFYVHYTEYNEA